MQARMDLEDLNVIIRRRGGRYLASMPRVGLYAVGDTVQSAIDTLEVKKNVLVKDLVAVGALDEVDTGASVADKPTRVLPALGLFAAKGLIVVVLVVAAIGFARHAVESEINHLGAQKMGGTVFWANLENNLSRAADPANDLPAARKQALLADLHVLVDRWRPFVREIERLFTDDESAKPANQ